ncbi:hypothetical protein FN846DRAFT_945658 [Sphaerosporella brunnea]|uniref:NmrA-like domain-containing protein n=1 Tax=Sphaerosporella brunnea TaxID=1250544 RepID=A0A5J5EZP4_9PEZI|nr:hypothetical protein FN846DRAFT_945658 [Sphaerosporella brunnea]
MYSIIPAFSCPHPARFHTAYVTYVLPGTGIRNPLTITANIGNRLYSNSVLKNTGALDQSKRTMAILSNVVIVGASGNLGGPVLSTLLADSSLNVTILARPESSILSSPPAGAKIVTADFSDKAAVAAALKGVDALLLTVGAPAIQGQIPLIDAAVEAGVKRVIPAEFGSNLGNEKTAALPVFAGKVEVRKYLEKLAAEGKTSWTAIFNGAFLDWGIKVGFLGVNVKEKSAKLYDGGERYFSTSLLSDVAKAVVGVLKHPEETKNKMIYVYSARLKQKVLVAAYEKALGIKLEVTEVSTEALEKASYDKIAKGDLQGFTDQIVRALLGEGYGGDFGLYEDSNELFGIKQVSEAELEEIIKANAQ